MLRQQSRAMEELLPGKIRKRGCSSSASSSSSVVQKYRFKRAILVGKRGGSSTPVPTWKLMGTMTSRSRTPLSALRAVDSPRSQIANRVRQQQPVSARKLAATLWEMNEMPSPRVKEAEEKRLRKEARARERAAAKSAHSGSFPPHLSDPSHSPVSERMHQSGTGSRHRRASSVSQRLRLMDHNVGALDSVSNASLMEIDARSQAQTPTGSTVGVKTRLKDVSNALTTSKELLKIINRVWSNEDRPSSSLSLISALHAELEHARLQVNHLIQEQRSDHNEISYLMKCFAEEKAAWKKKEQKVVEAAIESVAGELEVERKLRRQFESLNKKLGRELAETKAFLVKAVKELESEKRTRVVMEQVCNELASDIGEDKAEALDIRRESAKLYEEVEKERKMMQLADPLHEERVPLKLPEAKYQVEEKNAAVDKLRNQLEDFLVPRRSKDKGRSSFRHTNDDDVGNYSSSKARLVSRRNEVHEDNGEVEDGVDCENSVESDLHSIELNMDNNNSKSYTWAYQPGMPRDSRIEAVHEEGIKGRKSTSSRAPRRSTSLQRTTSDGTEWCLQNRRIPIPGDGEDWGRFSKLEQQALGKGYADEMYGYHQSVKGLRDRDYDYLLSGPRIESPRGYASPTRQLWQPRLSQDSSIASLERPSAVSGNLSKSRLADATTESLNMRKSKR